MNRRTTSEGLNIDALAQAFVDNASLEATIGVLPTGAFWASDEEMAVFKNADRGPILWKAGNHPECRYSIIACHRHVVRTVTRLGGRGEPTR